MKDFVLTSESVTAGHPDKLCDQISDALIDGYLAAGIRGPVAVECAIATGVVFLSVRAEVEPPLDASALARRVIEEAGYSGVAGYETPTIMMDLAREGRHQGVATGLASHMTTTFGHACEHTPEKLAFPVWSAHRLTRALDAARSEGRVPWLHPDAQAQVAVEFRDRQPARIPALAITAAAPMAPSEAEVRDLLTHEVIEPAMVESPLGIDASTRLVFVNLPWEGGPSTHSGLTGRKLADDTYGGLVRHSASALSGKSPARIDRTASYAARHAARSVVAAGLASECEVQLSYVIGDSSPVTIEVDTFGSGRVPDATISARLSKRIDFRVAAIEERFGLWELPAQRGGRFYRDLATYGQMGRNDLSPPWERTDEADALA